MIEMTQQKLIELAKYYINNDISLSDLARMNNTSKTTLVRYFSGNASIYLPEDLQKQVDAKKEENWIEGKATYGNQGNISFTKDELIVIAKLLVNENYTLKEIATTKNVSSATIYNLLVPENIGKDLYLEVLQTYKKHKESKNQDKIK